MRHLAIVVACLVSFRQLYTRSRDTHPRMTPPLKRTNSALGPAHRDKPRMPWAWHLLQPQLTASRLLSNQTAFRVGSGARINYNDRSSPLRPPPVAAVSLLSRDTSIAQAPPFPYDSFQSSQRRGKGGALAGENKWLDDR